jgi:hypothetical protein
MIRTQAEYQLKQELAERLQQIIIQIPIWDQEARSVGLEMDSFKDIEFFQTYLTKIRNEIAQWTRRN